MHLRLPAAEYLMHMSTSGAHDTLVDALVGLG